MNQGQNDSHPYQFKHNRFSSHNLILSIVASGSHVLDIGCGQGVISRHLMEKDCTVIGIDQEIPDSSFTHYMTEYHCWDLENPLGAIGEEQFDYVIAADVLEHVRKHSQLLGWAATRLKPDGLLVASTGNIALFVYRLLLLLGRFDYRERGILDQDHVHLFTLSSFKTTIEEAGFQIIDCQYTPIPLELVFGSRFGRSKLVEVLTSAYQVLARIWPQLFAYQIVIKAQPKT